jgi:hypothetical protein
MNNSNCPHCGKRAIPFLRKAVMGPAVPAKCRCCGEKVGVPFSSILTIIPIVLAIAAAQNVSSPATKALLWLAGVGIAVLLHWKFVPLVKM